MTEEADERTMPIVEGTREKILELLRETPALSVRELGALVGRPHTTVQGHLERLVAEGRIEVSSCGTCGGRVREVV